jgi:hypothetical protein
VLETCVRNAPVNWLKQVHMWLLGNAETTVFVLLLCEFDHLVLPLHKPCLCSSTFYVGVMLWLIYYDFLFLLKVQPTLMAKISCSIILFSTICLGQKSWAGLQNICVETMRPVVRSLIIFDFYFQCVRESWNISWEVSLISFGDGMFKRFINGVELVSWVSRRFFAFDCLSRVSNSC